MNVPLQRRSVWVRLKLLGVTPESLAEETGGRVVDWMNLEDVFEELGLIPDGKAILIPLPPDTN